MVLPLSTVSMLFGSSGSSSGGINLTALTSGASAGSGVSGIGSAKAALANAEKNEAKQLAQAAKDPQVQKDLARYAKVVKNAKSLDDVLNDPVARNVFMTANGLKGDVNNVGMAKRVLASDPSDSSSIAAKLASINGAWLDAVKTFNFAEYGVDRLSPKMDGVAGRWKVTIERNGEPLDAMLEITKSKGAYLAKVDDVAVPITVDTDGTVTLDLLYKDDADALHTTRLTGKLGKDGLSGTQADDGVKLATQWTAAPYFKDAIAEVSNNYIAEKRLDMLDQQMPGLGSAVLFKQIAKDLKDATDILGSALGREIITTAFSIPKQIAVQSLVAQQKAITQRMNPAKLQDAHFVDQIAQRYLIMLNGGTGGITA